MHIKTGEYYACKVINKKLMEGREYMVSLATPEARRAQYPSCLEIIRSRLPPGALSRRAHLTRSSTSVGTERDRSAQEGVQGPP